MPQDKIPDLGHVWEIVFAHAHPGDHLALSLVNKTLYSLAPVKSADKRPIPENATVEWFSFADALRLQDAFETSFDFFHEIGQVGCVQTANVAVQRYSEEQDTLKSWHHVAEGAFYEGKVELGIHAFVTAGLHLQVDMQVADHFLIFMANGKNPLACLDAFAKIPEVRTCLDMMILPDKACEYASVDFIRKFLPADFSCDSEFVRDATWNSMYYAALGGSKQIPLLQFLWEKQLVYRPTTPDRVVLLYQGAMQSDDPRLLTWLADDCGLDLMVFVNDMRFTRFRFYECYSRCFLSLHWLRERLVDSNSPVADRVLIWHYFLESMWDFAVRLQDIPVLDFCLEVDSAMYRTPGTKRRTLAKACKHVYKEVISWMIRHDLVYREPEYMIMVARYVGCVCGVRAPVVETLEMMRAAGFPVTPKVVSGLLLSSQHSVDDLEKMLKLGFPVDSSTMEKACLVMNFDAIKLLHRYNTPWSYRCLSAMLTVNERNEMIRERAQRPEIWAWVVDNCTLSRVEIEEWVAKAIAQGYPL